MYKCVIWSNNNHGREYTVATRSAMYAAQEYGRGECGEIVQIETLVTGRIISRVRWTPENGGRYVRVTV